MSHSHGGEEVWRLGGLLQVLRTRKTLIALIALLTLLSAALVTAFLPKTYLSTVKLRVEKPEGQVKLFQNQPTPYYDGYFVQDQFEILQSEQVLYPVIERLKLNERLAALLDSDRPFPTALSYRYLRRKALEVESRRNTSLLLVNVSLPDAALAAALANEIARVYAETRVAVATAEQREGLEELRRQLVAQEAAVSRQRSAVEDLRQQLGLTGVDLNARQSDIELERLRQLQTSLIELSVEATARRTRWERFRDIPAEQRIALVNTELVADRTIQELLQSYLAADQSVTRLAGRLGTAHPDLLAARENRAKIRQQLDDLLSGYEKSLEIAHGESQARVTALEQQLAEARRGQLANARDKLRPFEESVQRLDDETRLLTTLKLTLRQREIDFQVPKKSVEILNLAEPALRPARPIWALNLSLALLVGALLGIGTALAMEALDTSFRGIADLESALGAPVLGVIPAGTPPPSPAADEPARVLHTNLALLLPAGQARSLIVASAGPEEGKSTTLARLARALAAAGERVVLVDSDLRRPTQHRHFDRAPSPGLAQLLAGDATLDQALRRLGDGLPDVIFSGGIDGATLSVLHAEPLKRLVAELKKRYDRILLDSPPVIGVSDAAVLAGAADAALLLVEHRRLPAATVRRARQVIASFQLPLLGIVLNRVPPGEEGGDYACYTGNYAYYRTRETPSTATTSSTPRPPERLTLK